VDGDAILLNTRTNKYFALEKIGARLWELLKDDNTLIAAYQTLLDDYDVEPAELERDILELVAHLMEKSLVELAQE
jgi:hypothetical protein